MKQKQAQVRLCPKLVPSIYHIHISQLCDISRQARPQVGKYHCKINVRNSLVI